MMETLILVPVYRIPMNIHPVRLETDIPTVTRIYNACEPGYPTTEEEIRRWMELRSPQRIALHLVAADEQDAVVAVANCIHAAEAPHRHFYAWLGVEPGDRCRGVGSALWEVLLRFLREQNASEIASEVLDNDPTSLTFAEKRGFSIQRHRFRSILDLTRFDETPFLPTITALEAAGIRFCTLSDFPDSEETRRKYCELNWAAVQDIPGEDWDASAYPQFFYNRILGAPWFRREGQMLALDGDAWAGFAIVQLKPETRSAYNTTTGVARAYRGRKIAQALKIMAARYARQHGALEISTDNDSLNHPMLAINRKMGYVAQAGKYSLMQRIEENHAPSTR